MIIGSRIGASFVVLVVFRLVENEAEFTWGHWHGSRRPRFTSPHSSSDITSWSKAG
jgi:hypothetical protein